MDIVFDPATQYVYRFSLSPSVWSLMRYEIIVRGLLANDLCTGNLIRYNVYDPQRHPRVSSQELVCGYWRLRQNIDSRTGQNVFY